MYQTPINAHHHRSYRYTNKNVLRDSVETLPALLRRQGIYTVLAHIDHPAKPRYFTENPKNLGKSDYNFEWDTDVYDAGGSPGLQFDEWPGFTRDQRFFAQVQLRGGKHRPAYIIEEIDRDNVHYPSYYPRHPVLIERWASYLASVVELDNEVGLILDQLESRGLTDTTAVFFFSDHGLEHLRHKQSLYDGGIHVPLIVRWPRGVAAGTERSDLVSSIDISATTLQLAGIPVPQGMEGIPLFGRYFEPRKHIVAARDRSGRDIDRIRCVRTEDYKYIRNFNPRKPWFGPTNYTYTNRVSSTMRQLHEEGKLNKVQSRFLNSERPAEELYDLRADPYETINLAGREQQHGSLGEMRLTLEQWIDRTGDGGQGPEPSDEIEENTWYHS